MDDGGTANGGIDTSPAHTVTITVNEVNDAPSFANTGNVNVFKGGSTETIPGWASAMSAGPANESGQVLTFNVAVTSDPDSVLGSTPTVDLVSGNLVFDTTADNNGTATISVTLMDDGGTANGGVDTSTPAVINIIVGSVNDAPSFTAGLNQIHNEDDGAIVVNAWATAISAGPPDESGQMLTFNALVTSDPGSIFNAAPAIDAATGNLSYTLAADAFGVATVDITLTDDGGTANGGIDTSPAHTLTITVNEVNDAPSFSNTGNVNVFKGGGTETVPAWASALSVGPANESGQSFTGFNVTISNDPASVLGSTPTVDTVTGNLVFDTTADNNGTATISVTLMDDGGTANGGVDTSAAAVINIIVGSVNDAPSFTAGLNQTHNEDDGAIVVNAWATAISAGPPDESGQMLTFNALVTSDPGSIFSAAPAIDAATGNLSYTLAADAFGVATVDITLTDDGGTANGGVDTSPTHPLTITVNEINDAPGFANTGDVTVTNGHNTETIPAWATMLSTGPANEAGQSFTGFNVSVTSDPNSVLATTPAVDLGTGNLSFDTTLSNAGIATISVTLMDDGGTANGGVDTSTPAVITITVNPLNQPPVANNDSYDAAVHTRFEVGVSTAAPGHQIAGSVLTSGTPDSDPDAGTTLIVTGTSNLTPGAVLNMNANGTFTLLPPPNTTSGTVTFDYIISDQHPVLPLTDTGSVTITLFDPVWYVKNDHPGPSQGTSENPFQTLAEAEAAAGANHKIFVFTGDGTVTGQNAGITLLNGQSLIGERVDLVLDINGTPSTIVTGSGLATSAPRLGNTMGDVVTLADDNTVRGLILLPTASAGVAAVGVIPMKRPQSETSVHLQKYLDRIRSTKRAGGTTLVSDVLINPSGTSDGLVLMGQEGNFTFTNSEIAGLAGNTGVGLAVQNSMANFTFGNLGISNVRSGVFLNANTTAPSFTNTDISACSGTAIDLLFQDGASFDAASSVTQSNTGAGIIVFNGSGTFNFNGPVSVSGYPGGPGAIRLDMGGANAVVSFGDITLANPTGGGAGIALLNFGAASDINFNGLVDIDNTMGDGLNMATVSGTVDFSNASSDIANSSVNGVMILGGAPVLTYNGTLTDNTLSIFLQNLTGGSTDFNGLVSQVGGTNGFRSSRSAGTHSVAQANFGTMANRVSENGIRIIDSPGTFQFTDFSIFSTEAGMDVFGNSPTVTVLPGSTMATINATAQAIAHGGGTLTGTFTNVVADTTGQFLDGLELSSSGGGTLTFMDMDIDTTVGNGILANTAYNFNFTPASTITIDTNSGRGLFLVNGSYSGQIDRVNVPAGTNGGIFLSAMAGSLELGLVNITSTTSGTGFTASNSGTLSVTDMASSISNTGSGALRLRNIAIGANNMTFATVSSMNPVNTDGIRLDTVSGGTLTIGNAIVDSTVGGDSGIYVEDSSATFVFNAGNFDTSDATAIDLINNAGATFTFNNMDIDTTTGTGFDAVGGGTVSATGINTIDATTGRGVQIDGTSIAAANFVLRSVNTNGAINGIRLNNTGTLGGLRVVGTGSADSGGIIQNATADGIFLNNTVNFNIDSMRVSNSTASNINATSVDGLTLIRTDLIISGLDGLNGSNISRLLMAGCTLDQSGNAANEHGIRIINLLGSSLIGSSTFTSSATIHAFIQNTTASVAAPAAPTDILTFDNCSFSMPVAGTFGDNISVEAGNGANMRLILQDGGGQNTFVGGQDGVQAVTATGGTLDVIVANIDVQTVTGAGVNITGFNASDLTFDVRGISTLNTGSSGINAASIAGADMSGIIDNNTINGSTAGQGIQVITEGNGDITATISNNDIDNIDAEHGIRVQARTGSGTINATINNNDVNLSASPFPLEGIYVESGSSAGSDTNTICLNMFSNTSVSNSIEGFHLRIRPGTTFNLQDFVGNGNVPADITTWINTTKSNMGTTQVTGTGFTVAPANCPTPP